MAALFSARTRIPALLSPTTSALRPRLSPLRHHTTCHKMTCAHASCADAIEAFNKSYADSHDGHQLPVRPSHKLAIVTCMDSRILPSVQFGVSLGQTHIIRNAGGRTPDAFRSLVISQQMLGTEEIVVIQHTDCGMVTFTDEQARTRIQSQMGLADDSQGVKDLQAMKFLPFTDLEENVRKDVQFLKDSQIVKSDKVSGFVFDVSAQRLKRIV